MSASNNTISATVARKAAEWFLLMRSGRASPADEARLDAWREADIAHELAWQRARQLGDMLEHLPKSMALQILGRPARMERRTAIKTLAAILIAPPAVWLAWRTLPAIGWLADYHTATGEVREVRLADGTRVTLNTASAIDVAYGATERLIRLRAGEILVETAQDVVRREDLNHRALVVETRHGRLVPLGTRFLVKERDAQRSHVAVFAGAVEIHPRLAHHRATLFAGEQTDFSDQETANPGAVTVEAEDWTRGVLRVRNMPLAEFLAELERYRPGVVRCDPAVADLRISGAFQLRDTGAVLDSLARALPVVIRYRTRYWVTVEAAAT
ncbi:DUF4880 domain-containing protein [Bordetella petrii]|nr:DUF4880 domain-containing protein [Bordetella petrii]